MENVIKNMEKSYVGNVLHYKLLDKEKTAVIVVDMVNGFVREGIMASPRVDKMSKRLGETLELFDNTRKVFFIDAHDEESKEFGAYPKHCVIGTSESELIPELNKYVDEKSILVNKNSTNGFLAEGFQKWMAENDDVENYIVVGCVTDICVSDFARTLQCYIYEKNLSKQVIVPVDCVETFDSEAHNAHVMNVFALYNMKSLGINVVDTIK